MWISASLIENIKDILKLEKGGCHGFVHLKMVNFVLCNFTSIKKRKIIKDSSEENRYTANAWTLCCELCGSTYRQIFSVNRLENLLDICNNLKDEFSSSLHCKNTVYYTYNIHNTWASIVHVISEASCQQGAVSGHVSGEAEFTGGFPTAG